MDKRDRKEYKHQWYIKNKERLAEIKEKYRQEHKEDNKNYSKQYYEDNKKALSEYQKDYYQKNKEHIKERVKNYFSTPIGRAKRLVTDYKRKDIKYNRGECTLTEKWIIDNIFSKECIYCGETDYHNLGCDRIDNDKPHTEDNVVPCCFKCNSERGKKTFEEFLRQKKAR